MFNLASGSCARPGQTPYAGVTRTGALLARDRTVGVVEASRVVAALQVRSIAAIALAALVCTAAAQQMPWHEIPMRGHVSLSAFVHPPGLAVDAIGLDAVCFQGGFMPMLRLGQPYDSRNLDSIRVEATHSDGYLEGRTLWHYDPATSRAMPDDSQYWSGFAMVMEWGGSLRFRVWFHPDDQDPVLYTFGLDAFKALVDQVPCLKASASQSWATWWAWDIDDRSLMSGFDQQVQAGLFCPAEGPPVMALGFREALDPDADYVLVYIGSANDSARFYFWRVASGVYHADSQAAWLLLDHLVLREETIGLQMIGGPRPFLVLEPANLANLLTKLECIQQTGPN